MLDKIKNIKCLENIKKVKNIITKENRKYKEIASLFNITDITNEYILVDINHNIFQIHVYKIKPLRLFKVTKYISENVLHTYMEFLRSLDYNFQIFIENTKVEPNMYFNHVISSDENQNKDKLAKMYKQEIKEILKNNEIYNINYYLVVKIGTKDNIDEINKNIYNLEKIGVKIMKLKGKRLLNNFAFEKINKVDNI